MTATGGNNCGNNSDNCNIAEEANNCGCSNRANELMLINNSRCNRRFWR